MQYIMQLLQVEDVADLVGADTELADKSGMTPLHIAAHKSHSLCVELL